MKKSETLILTDTLHLVFSNESVSWLTTKPKEFIELLEKSDFESMANHKKRGRLKKR